MGLITQLFGGGGKPVRRDVHMRKTYDQDGHQVLETTATETFVLSRDGSIDRVIVEHDVVFHCGCDIKNGLGGRCGEPGCGRLSCKRCFTRCYLCHKPLCLECAKDKIIGVDMPVRLCKRCYEQHSRRRTIRALLSPFVVFHDKDR
jgi:hypothetical protein